jgi:rhodanese-related sulfurtransferase
MNKKIYGAIVCLILTLPGISITAVSSENNITYKTSKNIKTEAFDNDLMLIIYKAPGFIGINFDIENKGIEVLNNVKWSFRTKAAITGTGIFIREKLQEGIIDQINPGEKITLKFRPFSAETRSPLGIGTMYMNASAETENIYVRTQKQALILGFILIMYKETYMDIRPAEAYEKSLNEEFDLIIDVVGLDIYSLGHLPGAINYIWADGTLNSKIPELDPSWTYLVYCHSDPPSTASAQAMVNAGFDNIYRLEGNFKAWKDAGYPIET